MIASRLAHALKRQDWLTIAIELVLVTLGVLIALQLGAWAEARADQKSLRGVLERLDAETQTNIETMDVYLRRYVEAREATATGRQALEACDITYEAAQQVARSIGLMARDLDPTFLTLTAQELGRQDRFLDRLSAEFRAAFNSHQAQITEDNDQTSVNFMLLWDNHPLRHRAVSADLSDDPQTAGFLLAEPLSALCEDNEFRRRYSLSSAIVLGLEMRIEALKQSAEEFRAALAKERAAQG
jgi:hypothetical protein